MFGFTFALFTFNRRFIFNPTLYKFSWCSVLACYKMWPSHSSFPAVCGTLCSLSIYTLLLHLSSRLGQKYFSYLEVSCVQRRYPPHFYPCNTATGVNVRVSKRLPDHQTDFFYDSNNAGVHTNVSVRNHAMSTYNEANKGQGEYNILFLIAENIWAQKMDEFAINLIFFMKYQLKREFFPRILLTGNNSTSRVQCWAN